MNKKIVALVLLFCLAFTIVDEKNLKKLKAR